MSVSKQKSSEEIFRNGNYLLGTIFSNTFLLPFSLIGMSHSDNKLIAALCFGLLVLLAVYDALFVWQCINWIHRRFQKHWARGFEATTHKGKKRRRRRYEYHFPMMSYSHPIFPKLPKFTRSGRRRRRSYY